MLSSSLRIGRGFGSAWEYATEFVGCLGAPVCNCGKLIGGCDGGVCKFNRLWGLDSHEDHWVLVLLQLGLGSNRIATRVSHSGYPCMRTHDSGDCKYWLRRGFFKVSLNLANSHPRKQEYLDFLLHNTSRGTAVTLRWLSEGHCRGGRIRE